MNKYDKKCAIMETGYSTWSDLVGHGRDEQETFINTALPIIKNKVFTQNVINPNNKLVLSCWYELRDANTGGWGTENHFGILETGGAMKEAYDDLQIRIGEFYEVVG